MKPGSSTRTPPPAATTAWWQATGASGSATAGSQEDPLSAGLPPARRLYGTFLAARAALSVVLALVMLSTQVLNPPLTLPVLGTALAYVGLTVGAWWRLRPQRTPVDGGHPPPHPLPLSAREAMATIGVDLVCFSGLDLFVSDFNVSAVALLAMPVLMASALMPRIVALCTAAAASIILISAAVIHNSANGRDWSANATPAGLAGLGLFAVALTVSELASRLAREQRSALGLREQARQQSQLNQLLMEELPEGLLAVDRQGRVRTANPSARRLLAAHGTTPRPPFQLRDVPAWAPLVSLMERAFHAPPAPHEAREVALVFDDGSRRTLSVRLKFTRSLDARQPDEICVVFLEDARTVQARLRQDKLAAMGRMSAGIAHEIRNPLAAIAQANALMAEDFVSAAQHRLTTMVADNVERLKRIVDDILAVAPGVRAESPLIDLERMLRSIAEEWLRLHPPAREGGWLKVDVSGLPPREIGMHCQVRFEPEHLRRVLVNLLDNALLHGTHQPGSIVLAAQWLEVQGHPSHVEVCVASDGEAIDAPTERALFEPFFSTRSRGTGLGLYICRELCERHGASIDYRPQPPTQRHRNEFLILMPLAEEPDFSP